MVIAKIPEACGGSNCKIVYMGQYIWKDQVKDKQLLIPLGNASARNLYKSDLQT